ncbi:glycosyltransferase [Paenibacillus sp. RC67]|uniref:glycosyltransferase n=1 Tax=Paenibacillus sp. RC67 TaxID=3039392 RepID=UPI0024AD5985|nr:glycosyltransferase [Paenibacillus sp. RC67]
MNVLWLINVPLPEASILMNQEPTPFGGWLVNTSGKLAKQARLKLSIIFPNKETRNFELLQGENIKYYAFTPVKDKDIETAGENSLFENILNEVKPDIVHIFGTEFAHTLSMATICKKKQIKTVITIQGLVSIISHHYMASVPSYVQNRFTFRDFLKQDNIVLQQKKFIIRGEFETKALQIVDHVIGRTSWDKVCVLQINPKLNYHTCNEILRDEFYNHIWDLNHCEKHSIFVSQGSYTIKGLHFVIKAMPLILQKFPGAKLYIAGPNITKSQTLKEIIKISSYGKYIRKLIKENNLQEHVQFTGLLDEEQMCERFLKSNVFVSASTIENESNSLSEAKLLGVPSVASFVGGVIDRIIDKQDGFLYQHDAPYMLAHYVCKIFEDEVLCLQFSKNARENATKIHDRNVNLNKMLEIYSDIMNKSN